MSIEGYTQVGRILRAFGVNGELKVTIDIDFDETPTENEEGFTPVEAFFIQTSEGVLPYFVTYIRAWQSATPILKLEEVNTKEMAQTLQGMPLLLPNDMVDLAEDLTYTRLVGYTLRDARLGLLGEIDAIFDLPQQEVARIDYQGNEVLIPLHEDFLLEIDDVHKMVYVDLPDGLLDVYL